MRRLVVVLVMLAFPPTAASATATYEPKGDVFNAVFLIASAGEANDVTVTGTGSEVTIVDVGAPLDAGFGCVQLDPSSVRCGEPGQIALGVVVRLGNGADSLTITTDEPTYPDGWPVGVTWATIHGEGGDDTLVATDGPGTLDLNGGEGDDHVVGGPGEDELRGGGGDDTIAGGAKGDLIIGDPGDDSIDGGRGGDNLTFEPAPSRVAVSLASGRARGDWSGRDTFESIEIVGGTRFGDLLVGNERGNRLCGSAGPDTVVGRGGNDVLGGPYCEYGRDRLFGGAGDDAVRGGQGRDFLDGGSGRDTVRGQAGDDVIDGRDGEFDRLLSGGPGFDRATIDAGLDARIMSLERLL